MFGDVPQQQHARNFSKTVRDDRKRSGTMAAIDNNALRDRLRETAIRNIPATSAKRAPLGAPSVLCSGSSPGSVLESLQDAEFVVPFVSSVISSPCRGPNRWCRRGIESRNPSLKPIVPRSHGGAGGGARRGLSHPHSSFSGSVVVGGLRLLAQGKVRFAPRSGLGCCERGFIVQFFFGETER